MYLHSIRLNSNDIDNENGAINLVKGRGRENDSEVQNEDVITFGPPNSASTLDMASSTKEEDIENDELWMIYSQMSRLLDKSDRRKLKKLDPSDPQYKQKKMEVERSIKKRKEIELQDRLTWHKQTKICESRKDECKDVARKAECKDEARKAEYKDEERKAEYKDEERKAEYKDEERKAECKDEARKAECKDEESGWWSWKSWPWSFNADYEKLKTD